MSKIKRKIDKKITEFTIKITNGLAQGQTGGITEGYTAPEMKELLRSAAAQGSVLLKNNSVLPFAQGTMVSVFGRVQSDWFETGYGSGGDVQRPYSTNLITALRNCDKLSLDEELCAVYDKWREENPVNHGWWGHWPRSYEEMILDVSDVKAAAARGGKAVVVIGRASGEDRENALEKGSYYLEDEELDMLRKVCAEFDSVTVMLNIGCLIDLSWTKEFGDKIGALLIVWQGGMEGANAVADILCGEKEPGGRLTDTVAVKYDKYPTAKNFGNKKFNNYEEDIYVGYRWFETFKKEDVLYPFGFGLGYGKFEISCDSAAYENGELTLSVKMKNVGERSSSAVAQVYINKPCGVLGTPARELVSFVRSGILEPNAEEVVDITITRDRLSSYDESGATGFKSAYVMQKGSYEVYLGENVRDAEKVFSFELSENELVEQLTEVSAPVKSFKIVKAFEENGERKAKKVPVRTATIDLKERILASLPEGVEPTGDKGIKLKDVKEGRATLEEFVAQLSNDELEAITRGANIMDSPLGPAGNAGVFAGVIPSLHEKGVPPVVTTDGPSGIRLKTSCSLIPMGTLLACTFDTKLVEALYREIGKEMVERGTDVLLAPGINIHRDVLCGRNFEYYSEDPYVTGVMAAAAVRGVQSVGASACPKHFACNNQEYNRNRNDSRLSERALREIYLKGFEICVKTAQPKNIMSSYNKINGVWGHYNYNLCTSILRGEWKYGGNVITDWWMRMSKSIEFPKMRYNAYRVRSQVDVLMPGGVPFGKNKPDGTLLETLGQKDGITLGEIQRSAMNVLRFAMDSTAMTRMEEKGIVIREK